MLKSSDVVSTYKVTRAFRTKKASEVASVLEAIYQKVVCLNTQRYFTSIMCLSLKLLLQNSLKNAILTQGARSNNKV